MKADILLVIDMLKDFIAEDGKLFCGPAARAIIPNVKARVDAYRKDKNRSYGCAIPTIKMIQNSKDFQNMQ